MPRDSLFPRMRIFFQYVMTMKTTWPPVGTNKIITLLPRQGIAKAPLGLFLFKIFIKLIGPATSTTNMKPHKIYK